MGKPLLGAIALLTASLVVAAPAAAATRYAEPGGTGAHPCTVSDPCPIAEAVDGPGVADLDTVIIRPGSYTLAAPLALSHDITVQGHTGQQATITYATATQFQRTVSVNHGGGLLRDVRVVATGPGSALMVNSGQAEWVVAKSSGTPATCQPGVGANPPLRDSICHNTATNGVAVGIEAGCAGGPLPQDTSRLRNVTAIADGANSAGIELDLNEGCNIRFDGLNVIAQGTAADLVARTDANPNTQAAISMANSAFSTVSAVGLGASTSTPGSGANITEPPLFANAATGDFHQAQGSPTIDAGALGTHIGLIDIDGEPRQQGAGIDIGADETLIPETTITKKPRKRLITRRKRARVSFRFIANELGATFECKLNKRAFKPCNTPVKYRVRAARGKGKRHVFAVRATVSAGTDTTPAKWRWRVKRKR